MSPVGERIMEFLMSQEDIMLVRDESVATLAGQTKDERIECRHRGADYRITIDQELSR